MVASLWGVVGMERGASGVGEGLVVVGWGAAGDVIGLGGGESGFNGRATEGSGMVGMLGRDIIGLLSTTGVYLRRNLLFRRVTLPEPSTLMTY